MNTNNGGFIGDCPVYPEDKRTPRERALAAFIRANDLVKEGKYLEAILVDMLDSDIIVIVKKIKAASANRNET